MFLCGDPNEEAWAIEAREATGTIIVGLEKISHAGGIKRFCPNPDKTFEPGAWRDLALRVPKLGCLGARLTAHYLGSRQHTGTDVYAPPGSVVSSPIDGDVMSIARRSGLGISVEIASAATGISVLLAIGSPLGMRPVLSRLEPGAEHSLGRRPPGVRRWVNVADPGDPIAVPRKLRELFPGIQLDREDSIGPLSIHSATAYLAGPMVAASIAPFLTETDRVG
jgi:hypothetical protein